MRVMWIIVAAFLSVLSACSHTQLSRDEVRDMLIKKIKTEYPTACIKIQSEDVFNVGKDEARCRGLISTANAYFRYERQLEPLESSLQKLFKMAVENHFGPDAEKVLSPADVDRIVVQLRASDQYASVPELESVAVRRPFHGDISAILMLDDENSLGSVSTNALQELNLTEDQAFEVAATNLKRRMGEVRMEEVNDVTFVTSENSLATGLLWLPDACPTDPKESYHAFIADRDLYAKAISSSEKSVDSLMALATSMIEDGSAITDTILVCNAGKWDALIYDKSAD